MTWLPQPPLQTMRDASTTGSSNVVAPSLGVAIPTGDVVEGAVVRIEVRRAKNLSGAVAVTWTITVSQAADVTGLLTGTATLQNGETVIAISVQTVARTGTQGLPRQLTVTLTAPLGGELDPAASTATVPIVDRTAILPTWFNLTKRSARQWASGTADLSGTLAVDPNTPREQAVALLDAGCGHSRGVNNANVNSWTNVIGGAIGSPLLTTGTQFDWTENTAFGLYFQRSPLSTTWLLWNMVLIPTSSATNTGNAAVWTEISSGARDAEFRAMGARIVAAFAAKGHNINRFIGCPHIGMNVGDYFQVFPDTRVLYKAAIERALAQLRVGAGSVTLRFAHCPAAEPRIGPYFDWTPAGVDALGLDFQPRSDIDSDPLLISLIDGTGLSTARYGLRTDLLDHADTLNVPVLLPRWAVHHELGQGCPFSAGAVQRLHDDFLQANFARVVCDCVSNLAILNASGYLDVQAGAAASWAQAVANYDTGWDGAKSVVNYVPPTINISARVASVQEG